MTGRTTGFAGLVLDVDSTLSRVEGIAWLAARRGGGVARQVEAMTEQAMNGAVPLEEVYSARLAIVRPSRADITALADAYRAGILPGAREALAALRARGVRLTIVSGGIREAILPLAADLGVPPGQVHAVPVTFARDGQYTGFDAASPLTRRWGKPTLLHHLALDRPLLAIGDGSTDAELKTYTVGGRPQVDAFAAFVGVANRPSVVRVADYVVHRFADLPSIVMGEAAA